MNTSNSNNNNPLNSTSGGASNYIQIVYLYDVKSSKELGKYIPTQLGKSENKILAQARDIKQSINDSQAVVGYKHWEAYSKINFFKYVSKNNILYIVGANIITETVSTNESNNIYDFIDEIDNQKIFKFTDKNGELNNVARQNLQYLIDKYQDQLGGFNSSSNRISQVKSDIDGATLQMKDNIKSVISNIDDAKMLDNKANRLKDSSMLFRKDSEILLKNARWRKYKYIIAIVLLVIIVVIFVCYTFFKSDDENNN